MAVNSTTSFPPMGGQPSLFDRLGGIFSIAAVVDRFSDQILANPLVGVDSPNPQLRNWSRNDRDRLPGFKWMRTLWVADVSGGPYQFVPTVPENSPLDLANAHRNLKISPAEFDEVAKILAQNLDFFKVPAQEKNEVLMAFAAHKNEVTAGYFANM